MVRETVRNSASGPALPDSRLPRPETADTATEMKPLPNTPRRELSDEEKHFFAELDRQIADARRSVLRGGPPREQCPGCFAYIYDGAAKQGWCCDCYPKRSKYEKEAYGY